MTKFENEALLTLLKMKKEDLTNNPPQDKNINPEKIQELADKIDNVYHALIAIEAFE